MVTWTRRSGRNWLGALFSLAMLLQGAGCILYQDDGTPYTVPGIKGQVYSHRYDVNGIGTRYYAIQVGTNAGGGPIFRYVYEGSSEYEIIERFFRTNSISVAGSDRSGIPGGTGTLPVPAVQ